MKYFNWNHDKNCQLIDKRHISFADIVFNMQTGHLLDDTQHSNQDKYPNQRIFVVEVNSYAYLVPYVENDNEIFLKTIIPSRKATKLYLGEVL